MISHWRIRIGSDWWFSKIFRIRTESDSILLGQDWTRPEKFYTPLISGKVLAVFSPWGTIGTAKIKCQQNTAQQNPVKTAMAKLVSLFVTIHCNRSTLIHFRHLNFAIFVDLRLWVLFLESWSHSRLSVVPTSSQLRGTVSNLSSILP